MRVCILGGGGNGAEAIAAVLAGRNHTIFQFRFGKHIEIAGIPQRPPRSKERLQRTDFVNVSGNKSHQFIKQGNVWISPEQFGSIDVFLLAYPSYIAEHMAQIFGPNSLAGKALVNLSDRFLGTYSLLRKMYDLYGAGALPYVTVAFNGVPVMAQKPTRDAPVSIFYVKPRHSISWYPQSRQCDAYKILHNLFDFNEDQLLPYPSMLHLAFENVHCVEHAVADLYNLQRKRYQPGGRLYSPELYPPEVVDRINKVVCDRDSIAQQVVHQKFTSLRDYDIRVFGHEGHPGHEMAGTNNFRIKHSSLSKAPNPEEWNAFGYEDVGWSMVTLESFGIFFGVGTPHLSSLINDWNLYMACDYRQAGRTISTLRLVRDQNKICSVKELNWLPDFFHTEMGIYTGKVDTVAGRQYNPDLLLDPETILIVFDEFKTVAQQIFKKNLAFGFVFGGFAKGYAIKGQDIDMFICLFDENSDEILRFQQWYFDVHRRFDLAPDVQWPGEITTVSHLKEKLLFLKSVRLRPIIETNYEYEAIVWGDIFCDMKGAKIGDLGLLNEMENLCAGLSQKWRKELIAMHPTPIELETAKLPLTRLFRRLVKYQKTGCIKTPPMTKAKL